MRQIPAGSTHLVSTFPDLLSLMTFLAFAVASMVRSQARALPLLPASLVFGSAAGSVLGISSCAQGLLTWSAPSVALLSGSAGLSLLSSLFLASASGGLVQIVKRNAAGTAA